MGFENCEVGFGKKNEMENRIGTPLQERPIYMLEMQGIAPGKSALCLGNG